MKKLSVCAAFIALFLVVNSQAQVIRPRIVSAPTSVVSNQNSDDTNDNSGVPNTAPRPTPTLKGAKTDNTPRPSAPVLRGTQTTPTPTPTPNNSTETGDDDGGVINIETSLVTIPVSVLDRNGRFISGLQQKNFKIFEDGVEQKVEYFATTETPFTVALVLDMSNSTRFKLEEIRDAAIAFVNQLRPQDKVMVVSFDDNTHVLTEPTNDRYALQRAIQNAKIGSGTALYDTIDFVINRRFNQIQGRKAIVLFTDGVDTTSKQAKYQTNVQDAEELDSIIYPIKYDTFADMQTSSRGTVGFPRPRNSGGSILDKILSGVISGGNIPSGGRSTTGASREEYERAGRYLNDLANVTGGRLFNADSTGNLDTAFSSIAEELRRQYSLGYYPENEGKAGQRKQIKVRVNRPNLAIKARESYIVGENDTNAKNSGKPTKFAGKFKN